MEILYVVAKRDWERLEAKVDVLTALVLRDEEREIQIMQEVDELEQEVTEEETLIGGLEKLVDGLEAQVAAAGPDKAKLQDVLAKFKANKARMVAALAANVPPGPPVPQPVGP